MFSFKDLSVAALIAASTLPAFAADPAITTFENGTEGWQGPAGSGGASFVTFVRGNPYPAYRTRFEDFGIAFTNSTNPSVIGDFTQFASVEFSLDVKTLDISFSGTPVTRDLIVELRDYDNPEGGYPYTSVWARLGTLDASIPGWQHLTATILDTSALALPAGWGGYGAEDPVTYEPTLPAGRSFASVLAGVDEIAFTTLVPGFFYGFTFFDVVVDNLAVAAVAPPVTAVPEPATGLLLAAGLAVLAKRRRARA